jgi:hypothetical protein
LKLKNASNTALVKLAGCPPWRLRVRAIRALFLNTQVDGVSENGDVIDKDGHAAPSAAAAIDSDDCKVDVGVDNLEDTPAASSERLPQDSSVQLAPGSPT